MCLSSFSLFKCFLCRNLFEIGSIASMLFVTNTKTFVSGSRNQDEDEKEKATAAKIHGINVLDVNVTIKKRIFNSHEI